MEQFIGCDAHKKFSLFVAMNEDGEYGRAIRVGMVEKCSEHFSRTYHRARKSPWKPAGVTTGWWMRWSERDTGRG